LSGLFSFITYPMELGLVWLALAVGSAGVGIILFTIFVRAVLAPLQITQLRNAKNMQRLQPVMAELRKKHGNDKQKLSQETMSLYREHNVNPAMGCLPMLVQLPILFGLFYALLHLGSSPDNWPAAINWAKSTCNGVHVANWAQWYQHCYGVKNMPGNPSRVFQLFHADFLWLSHGLGRPDPFYILPLLAGATQWLQSRMMLTKSADPQQQMMNTMMNFMPLMIIIFAARYPSGLALYWVTSTVIGILVQYRITGWGLVPYLGDRGSGPGRGRAATPAKPRAPKPSPLAPTPTDTEPNGSNGDGLVQETTPRPRKKANRARGGRGGGRRG
jgi:YidC/Oxa1 family membrane protein insertase